MARITEIEAFEIYPEFQDFNGLYLAPTAARSRGAPSSSSGPTTVWRVWGNSGALPATSRRCAAAT